MPLEISEIGVHIAVGSTVAPAPPPPPSRGGARGGAGPGGPPAGGAGVELTPQRIDEIVATCVHEVLHELRMRGER